LFLQIVERIILFDEHRNAFDNLLKKVDKQPAVTYLQLLRRLRGQSVGAVEEVLPFKMSFLSQHDSLVQQVKLLCIAESTGNYNVAFNHLLNCFQYYCYTQDMNPRKPALKNYDRQNVIDYLRTKKASSLDDSKFVISFYDRRNKNTISHPGEKELAHWPVAEQEYRHFKSGILSLIKRK
jgi:hypothetical protein